MKFQKISIMTFLLCSLSLSIATQAEVISDTTTGKKTMSKFMLNLAKFVTWPDNKFAGESEPYRYCLMGEDPFDGVLDLAVAEKQAKNRGFQVERIEFGDIPAAKECHVVFLNVAEANQAAEIVDALEGLPVLTVGEVDKFAQYGGMVGFIGEGRKVALAVNQGRLEGAGLKASSRLYRASTM